MGTQSLAQVVDAIRNRARIMHRLQHHGPASVDTLMDLLGLTRETTRKHLKRLQQDGAIGMERSYGRDPAMYYSKTTANAPTQTVSRKAPSARP